MTGKPRMDDDYLKMLIISAGGGWMRKGLNGEKTNTRGGGERLQFSRQTTTTLYYSFQARRRACLGFIIYVYIYIYTFFVR